nr:hypothetical protein [Tanacetum cinerariifolium]
LHEFADDTVTDYSRPSLAIESTSNDVQSRNSSETEASTSTISSKPFIKFVKATDRPTENKTDKAETVKKPTVKYAELYRKPSKKSTVRGNQRNWNNLKSQQGEKGRTCPMNTHKTIPSRPSTHRPPMRTNSPYMNAAQPKRTSFYNPAHSYNNRHFQRTSAVRSQFRAPRVPTVTKKFPTVNRKFTTGNTKFSTADVGNKGTAGNFQNHIDDKGYWDSGCSRHMTGNISYLSDYEPFDGGYVSFGQGGCKITGKRTIKTRRDFKLIDDTNVLLRTPRQHNMYSIDLNNIVPHKDLTCLVAKASADECMLWHRRLGQLNIKTMNRLVRHNLVRGLPSKCFENDHTCVACLKGKQHKASCKTKLVNLVTKPIHTLHMDLFGPTSTFFLKTKDETSGILRNFITEIENLKELRVKIIRLNHKWYCLVVTDDFSRFTWTFFLRTKDENSGTLRNFITEIENLKDLKTTWGSLMLKGMKVILLVVVIGTSSTNISGTKDVASQAIKKDVSSLRYIAIPNWFHEAHMESSNTDQIESLIGESAIPTVSSPIPTACLDISPETSSDLRLISKEVLSQEETPSLDNALTLSNRFEDTIGVEADLSNMESSIPASPTPTFRFYKDHPKSQIIGPVDTPVQTRHKSKEMEEHIYQMDVKSAFLYGTTDEEVYVMQPPGFQDLEFPDRVYKVEKAMYGLHQAPRAWYDVRSANTPMDKENPWGKDRPGKDVELHLYRSMIGSLMYLTASRPDIMFDVYACAKHQVTPKEYHLHAIKRIFRYLKDRKTTTGGCQFLGRRLILWQCKKNPIVATSTTEAEYVAAVSGCGQVLWIQNQMLDYGVDHIHTDDNVADLLTKPFDVGRFQYLVLAFCDYHNMIAILEKTEHKIDFHQIVDFIEASHIRIETTNEETKILAIVDGKPRTISESSLRRHLKLNDAEGISSLPDT